MRQTDPDFEQILIEDDRGRGIHWANQQIMYSAEVVKGQYVYVLDDDDFLISENFISELKSILERVETLPDVIFVKGYINSMPMPKFWETMPGRGSIGSPNFIVSNKMFCKYAKCWNQPRAGDWHFISAVLSPGCQQLWWDKLVFYASASCGLTEAEKRAAIEEMLRRAGDAQNGNKPYRPTAP